MVRIPSLSRRSEPAPTSDENLDGRVDGRDTPVSATGQSDDRADGRVGEAERRASERAAVARAATARPVQAEPRTGRPVAPEPSNGSTPPVAPEPSNGSPHSVAPEPRTSTVNTEETKPGPSAVATTTRTAERDADLDNTTRRPDTTDRPVSPAPGTTTPEPPVARGPKPRASLLATLGLIVSVVGATFVLSGTLAGYGIGLGAFGAVLAVLGLMATRRRHVAGTTDALFGVLIGLAAVVIGVLAMTGQFDWPTTDGDWVSRFREWLDSQFVDRF